MKPRPIKAVDRFFRASERLVVAAFLMIWVSSDSLLKSSPVRVISKKAISCRNTSAILKTSVAFFANKSKGQRREKLVRINHHKNNKKKKR